MKTTPFEPPSAGRGNPMLDATLRGAGQVIFMNNPLTGALNLAALAWGAWMGGTAWVVLWGALLGTLAATAAARALGLPQGEWRAGLYGFNGLLVGAALPTFLAVTPALWALLVAACAGSALAARALERALGRLGRLGVPGLTFPFIAVTWAVLALAPALGLAGAPAPAPWAAPGPWGLPEFGRAVAVSVAQVFFVDDAGAGVIFLLALAVHSRAAAALAALGAAVGVALALAVGADGAAVAHGMWGYAAALTAPAVGCVFMRASPAALALALGAAALTVAVQAAAFALAGAMGGPSLTIAFVLTTWAVLLVRCTTRRA